MSLSDYIKYLRAVKGGVTPWEIAEGSGVAATEVHLLEVKHRRVGEDDATLAKLADYFGVPLEELTARREQYRKLLTQFLEDSLKHSNTVTLTLESGEQLTGKVEWYSREALALTPANGEENPSPASDPYIVQRNWVASWQAA
jgi:transcriptional regulator with XRE-family HTH domain